MENDDFYILILGFWEETGRQETPNRMAAGIPRI
jgi:hypothetical protein